MTAADDVYKYFFIVFQFMWPVCPQKQTNKQKKKKKKNERKKTENILFVNFKYFKMHLCIGTQVAPRIFSLLSLLLPHRQPMVQAPLLILKYMSLFLSYLDADGIFHLLSLVVPRSKQAMNEAAHTSWKD